MANATRERSTGTGEEEEKLFWSSVDIGSGLSVSRPQHDTCE